MQKTAQEFYDSEKNKESYYWKTSGIHTYNVMLRFEGKEKSKNCKVKETEQQKFKKWLKDY